MKHLALLILVLIIIVLLQGCSTLKDMKIEGMDQGCVVLNAHAKLGYVGQEGTAQACRLVCSEKLPQGYKYEFDNGLCKVSLDTTKSFDNSFENRVLELLNEKQNKNQGE